MLAVINVHPKNPGAEQGRGPGTAQDLSAHGLRSRVAVLPMENPREYQELLAALREEWQPATLTEADLVEQLAVNKWKIARYEAAEAEACEQSALVHRALDGSRGKSSVSGNTAAERAIARCSQLISRLERSYFRSLQFLIRLQDRRRKLAKQAPSQKPEDLSMSRSASAVPAAPPVTQQAVDEPARSESAGLSPATASGKSAVPARTAVSLKNTSKPAGNSSASRTRQSDCGKTGPRKASSRKPS